jgi:ABC-type phosphate transport system substrate-binding protein
MRFLRGKRVASACVLASALALMAPGVASAKKSKTITQCSGVSISGQGAAVAANAETLWTGQFSSVSDTNAAACSGTQGTKGTPTVTYISTSSGKGLNSWGAGGSLVSDPPGFDGFGTDNAFIATEEAPNASQVTDIENQETSPGSVTDTVLSFPVAQESIIPIVNLPAGCTGSSTFDSGRIVLDNVDLEKIFEGTITNWSEITEDGDKLSGASCNPATEITRVVRPDQAGTTHVLKNYLGLINSGSFPTSSGTETWDQLSEGTLNIVWPTGSTPLVSSSSTGDSAEIAKVVATPSSIGYASLSDVRNNTSFVPAPSGTGGPGTATFWTPVQDDGVITTTKAKYADPASNGEVDAKGTANCLNTKYTNGVTSAKFPPKNVDETWDTVTTATKEKAYSICAIVFTEALGKYSAFPGSATGEAQTVSDYINYDISTATGGGQTLLNGNDYEALPSKLIKEDIKDLPEITQ